MITGKTPPFISGTPSVEINPNQPLKRTNNLQIAVEINGNGITRTITITNGLV